jgi:hypothetical protein
MLQEWTWGCGRPYVGQLEGDGCFWIPSTDRPFGVHVGVDGNQFFVLRVPAGTPAKYPWASLERPGCDRAIAVRVSPRGEDRPVLQPLPRPPPDEDGGVPTPGGEDGDADAAAEPEGDAATEADYPDDWAAGQPDEEGRWSRRGWKSKGRSWRSPVGSPRQPADPPAKRTRVGGPAASDMTVAALQQIAAQQELDGRATSALLSMAAVDADEAAQLSFKLTTKADIRNKPPP